MATTSPACTNSPKKTRPYRSERQPKQNRGNGPVMDVSGPQPPAAISFESQNHSISKKSRTTKTSRPRTGTDGVTTGAPGRHLPASRHRVGQRDYPEDEQTV